MGAHAEDTGASHRGWCPRRRVAAPWDVVPSGRVGRIAGQAGERLLELGPGFLLRLLVAVALDVACRVQVCAPRTFRGDGEELDRACRGVAHGTCLSTFIRRTYPGSSRS